MNSLKTTATQSRQRYVETGQGNPKRARWSGLAASAAALTHEPGSLPCLLTERDAVRSLAGQESQARQGLLKNLSISLKRFKYRRSRSVKKIFLSIGKDATETTLSLLPALVRRNRRGGGTRAP